MRAIVCLYAIHIEGIGVAGLDTKTYLLRLRSLDSMHIYGHVRFDISTYHMF